MNHLFKTLGFTLCALALLTSCDSLKKAKSALGGIIDVQKNIAKFLDNDSITVNINNTSYMNIGVVNSKLQDLPADQKKVKAREIAQIAYDSYPSRSDLEQVRITFVVQKNYVVFHYTNAADSLAFKANDLAKTSKVKPEPTTTPAGTSKT